VTATSAFSAGQNAGPGWIDHACWLAGDVLLLLGWLGGGEDEELEAWLKADVGMIPLELRALAYTRADTPPGGLGAVLVARLPAGTTELGALVLRAGEEMLSPGPAELSEALVEVDVIAESLASLGAEVADELAELLASVPASLGTFEPAELERSVGLLLARLQERPTEASGARSRERRALSAERLLAVDDRAFHVAGWVHDEAAELTRLTAISPEGLRAELLERVFRYRRPDIEQFYALGSDGRRQKPGFFAFFTLEESASLEGWTLEAEDAAGAVLTAEFPAAERDPIATRDAIISDLTYAGPRDEALMFELVHPAIERLLRKTRHGAELEAVVQYGDPVKDPDVSIVVPLYRRVDLLEHQLAQLADDPVIRGAELVYVLDSPELADRIEGLAEALHELYRLPFRLAILTENVGFAEANNLGASLARGRLLLFLNSDVVPANPAWLEALSAFYDLKPHIGALAPKLLFEDDSLQHAGIYFRRAAGAPFWENAHYYKGLHRSLPDANVTRPVAAVTAACLMIDHDLFERVGGFRGIYVQGDYEDTDLCLRLREDGLENWYLPEVELYHLEGQSYPSELRRIMSRYNAWLHTRTWSERIEALVENGYPAP